MNVRDEEDSPKKLTAAVGAMNALAIDSSCTFHQGSFSSSMLLSLTSCLQKTTVGRRTARLFPLSS